MKVQPTVFLVDDDNNFRRSLRFLLEAVELEVEEFVSAAAFLEGYDPQRPGCLVLDIRMPEMSGLELQQYLIDRELSIPIIFITGHGDIPMSVKAVKNGAVDFLEKPFDDELLIDRIKSAFQRDVSVRRTDKKKLAARKRWDRLTPREKEVMTMIVTGRTNKDIAAELKLSHRTVEVHRARIMTKTACESLPDLISLAASCGVLPTH